MYLLINKIIISHNKKVARGVCISNRKNRKNPLVSNRRWSNTIRCSFRERDGLVECTTNSYLFGRDEKTIRKHINNAIREELSFSEVVAKFATTSPHGAIEGKVQSYLVNYYNLDVIIAVGYREKSKRDDD